MKLASLRNALLALAGACGLFISCSKEPQPNKDVPVEKPSLSVSTNELAFSAFGEEKTFEVTANMEGFTAAVTEGDETWCHVTIDGNIVKVLVDKNEAYEMRSTTVTVVLKTLKKRVRIEQDAAPDPANMPKVFAPMGVDQFVDSRVYNVVANGVKVAQICREYLSTADKKIDNQAIVVYPVKDGVADLTKGIVTAVLVQGMDGAKYTDTYTVKEGAIHGGTVAFDAATNLITAYEPGLKAAADIKFLCYDEKGVLSIVEEKTANMQEATLEPETAQDGSQNTYGVVKVAAQYWLASDLITTKQIDGTDIPENTVWGADYAGGAFRAPSCTELALLYSSQAAGWDNGAFGNDLISPKGYTLPTQDQINALNAYLNLVPIANTGENQSANTKMRSASFVFDTWEEPWKTTGSSNISGLGIICAGYHFADAADIESPNMDQFYLINNANQFGLTSWHLSAGSVNAFYDAWGDARLGKLFGPIRCIKM